MIQIDIAFTLGLKGDKMSQIRLNLFSHSAQEGTMEVKHMHFGILKESSTISNF